MSARSCLLPKHPIIKWKPPFHSLTRHLEGYSNVPPNSITHWKGDATNHTAVWAGPLAANLAAEAAPVDVAAATVPVAVEDEEPFWYPKAERGKSCDDW